jgi:hypothetical protein
MPDLKMQLEKEERSLGDLFTELAAETGTLVRQEVALAQVEITAKATNAGKSLGVLAAGGVLAHGAMLAILTAVVVALSTFMALWMAALLVGLIVGVIAFLVISSALGRLKKADLTPNETVRSIKEDARWLKRQVS